MTRKFNFQDPDNLFSAVGYGGITTAQVVKRLTNCLQKEEEQPVILPDVKTMSHRNHKAGSGSPVKVVDNLLIRLSRCCNPVPGDDIAGYVTQGRGSRSTWPIAPT